MKKKELQDEEEKSNGGNEGEKGRKEGKTEGRCKELRKTPKEKGKMD